MKTSPTTKGNVYSTWVPVPSSVFHSLHPAAANFSILASFSFSGLSVVFQRHRLMAILYDEIDGTDKVRVQYPRFHLQTEVPRVMAREKFHDKAIAWVSRFRATNKPSIFSLPKAPVTHATTSIGSDLTFSIAKKLDEL
jgi:hypothetical protein